MMKDFSLGVMAQQPDQVTMRQGSLPIALLRAREAMIERIRPILNAHMLTEQQWRVLCVLAETGTSDATAVAAAAYVLPPSLTRMLRSLEARGYIQVCRDPDDRRRSQITVTPEGSKVISRLMPATTAAYAEITDRIGAETSASMLKDLTHLIDVLNRK